MELVEVKTKRWDGFYKGVSSEINNWKIPSDNITPKEQDCWTYYIYLNLSRIPKEHNPASYWLKKITRYDYSFYDYFNHNVMNDLDWHGGITWYSKEGGFDRTDKIIKIGCDYRHAFDEGISYDLDIVTTDCKRTIERFLEKVPNYKCVCCGNGKLYDFNEGIIFKNQFYSKDYLFKHDQFKNLILST